MVAGQGPGADPWCFVAPREMSAGFVVCRRWQDDDADVLLEAVTASLAHLRPWMPWVVGYDIDGAREFLARNSPRTTAGGDEPVSDAAYAICDRAGGILGSCGLHGRLGAWALEIGYWVDVRHTRRGVAKLAAALLTETALTLPGIEHVEIRHDAANIASGAVPASLGYTHIATITCEPEAPGETGVDFQWRMGRDEFGGSRAAALLDDARR